MMEVTIRKAVPGDLPRLLDIFARARRFMRENGNPTQWGENSPSEALVRADIAAGDCYVLEAGGEIRGTFALLIGEEPSYREIDGAWPADSSPYGTIHRVASDGSVKGLAARCFAYCAGVCPHLRIDTHRDNAPMRAAVERAGFRYCGVVRVADGTERLAFNRVSAAGDMADK